MPRRRPIADGGVLVATLGVEGGGSDIVRRPDAGGGHAFWVEGSSWGIDADDNEFVREWKKGPARGLEEALELVRGGGEWVLFYPMDVHPDFGPELFALFERAVRGGRQGGPEVGEGRINDWRRACLPGPRRGR